MNWFGIIAGSILTLFGAGVWGYYVGRHVENTFFAGVLSFVGGGAIGYMGATYFIIPFLV